MSYILAVVCSALILVADQITKFYVANNFAQLSEQFPLVKNVLNFVYVQNGGAAFGIFNSRKWLLIAVAIIIIIMCVCLLIKKAFSSKKMFWAICLVLAGGIGNLIDRVFRDGLVIDFIQFDFFKSFPVFNIADISVCVGAGLILLCFILDFMKESQSNKEPAKKIESIKKDEQ